MPTSQDYHILFNNCSISNRKLVVLTHLSEEEENLIDNLENKSINIVRGNKTFNINHNQIYCYGEIDLLDKQDRDAVSKFNFLNQLGAVGYPIYSRYDYKTHTCSSPKKHPLWTETWDPLDLVLYAHGALGKPNRVILFYYVPKALQKKRSR